VAAKSLCRGILVRQIPVLSSPRGAPEQLQNVLRYGTWDFHEEVCFALSLMIKTKQLDSPK
jgi:hypothetical protein